MQRCGETRRNLVPRPRPVNARFQFRARPHFSPGSRPASLSRRSLRKELGRKAQHSLRLRPATPRITRQFVWLAAFTPPRANAVLIFRRIAPSPLPLGGSGRGWASRRDGRPPGLRPPHSSSGALRCLPSRSAGGESSCSDRRTHLRAHCIASPPARREGSGVGFSARTGVCRGFARRFRERKRPPTRPPPQAGEERSGADRRTHSSGALHCLPSRSAGEECSGSDRRTHLQAHCIASLLARRERSVPAATAALIFGRIALPPFSLGGRGAFRRRPPHSSSGALRCLPSRSAGGAGGGSLGADGRLPGFLRSGNSTVAVRPVRSRFYQRTWMRSTMLCSGAVSSAGSLRSPLRSKSNRVPIPMRLPRR